MQNGSVLGDRTRPVGVKEGKIATTMNPFCCLSWVSGLGSGVTNQRTESCTCWELGQVSDFYRMRLWQGINEAVKSEWFVTATYTTQRPSIQAPQLCFWVAGTESFELNTSEHRLISAVHRHSCDCRSHNSVSIVWETSQKPTPELTSWL